MAVQLHEGGYALAQNSAEKIVLQVKLTDSALRAIEEYHDMFQKVKLKRPSLRLDGNQGSINIPVRNEGEVLRFTFQLTALDQSSTIDCLQQFEARELTGRVAVLGGIQHKITVNANDDTYNATRKRMTLVKEQEQKTSTKVIKQPSCSKAGKSTLLRRQVLDQSHSSFSHGRHVTPSPSRPTFNRSSSPLTTGSVRSESPLSSAKDLAAVRNKTKPTLSSVSGSTTVSPSSAGSEHTTKSIHEAVVQFLAPKPLRYQELMLKLSRHVLVPDTTLLPSILRQVASARTVGKGEEEYALAKDRYSEVRPDWPHYTEEERASVRKKQVEIRLGSSDNRKRTQANSPHRRGAEDEANYTNPVKKKQRVSLYNKTSPTPAGNRARTVSPLEPSTAPTVSGGITSSSVVRLNDLDIPGLDIPGRLHNPQRSPKRSRRRDDHDDVSPPAQKRPSAVPPPPQDQPEPLSNSTSERNRDTSSSVNDPEEYIKKYKTIQFSEERNQYKKDFSVEYKEYLSLHAKVATQCKCFSEWQRQINELERGTETYKTIVQRVFEEYKRLREDASFVKDRDRVRFLHRKLKHIKDLVLEYDRRHSPGRLRDEPGIDREQSDSESPLRRSADVVHKRSLLTA